MATKRPDPAKVAQDVLRDMLKDKSRGVRNWRIVATALAGSDEAPEGWRAFGPVTQDVVLRVVSRVRQSFDATLRELARPREERAELAALARVRKLAGELDQAIRNSSLPGNQIHYGTFTVRGSDGADVPMEIGWHSLNIDPQVTYGAVSVSEVLAWAIEAVDRHQEWLPARAARRRHDRTAHVQIFVRYLAWHFQREFGEEKRTAIARFASALRFKVDGVAAPLDLKQIDGFLKDRPQAFIPPPKRRTARAT